MKIAVVGGVALALGYDARARTTRDLDAVIPVEHAHRVIEAADAIAREFGLTKGWLNERARAAGYTPEPLEEGPEIFTSETLTVVATGIVDLLASKLPAGRDKTDRDDCILLMKRLLKEGNTPDGIWDVVGGRVPLARRGAAKHNFQRYRELIDELP